MNDPNARELSAEMRARVGIPKPANGPFRWEFALFLVAVVSLPLALAGLYKLVLVAVIVGLVVWPAMRWSEDREVLLKEHTFKTGQDTVGHVVAVEPGERGVGHIVRVDFSANGTSTTASVQGCPLARKGLMPGEEVVVRFDSKQPLRCLILGRTGSGVRSLPNDELES